MLNDAILYDKIKNEMQNNITLIDGSHPFKDIPDSGKLMIYNGTSATGFDVLIQVITDKVYQDLVQNLEIVAKPRIDNYGTEIDTMITTIEALAATSTATGLVPVTGATLGVLLTTLSTAMKIGQGIRTLLKSNETIQGTQIK